jgi:chemotaxis protein MotB
MARRKRRAEWHHENLERWLLTYADMITLLMLFFIVLYSMSNIDSEKYKQISESLSSIFNGGNFTLFLDQAPAGGAGVMEGVQPGKQVEPKQTGKALGTGGTSLYMTQATSSLQNFIKSGKVKVIPTERGFAISLVSDLSFGVGSADLGSDALPVLRQVADFLSQISNPIVVEGHTDSASVSGTKWTSNWELSAERAVSVLQALQAYGVPSDRLSAATYGETRPIMTNDTPEGRAYNRRVDIVIVEK